MGPKRGQFSCFSSSKIASFRMPRKLKLPPGVAIVEEPRGSEVTWRVRLGKKFTGMKVERKRFAVYQEAIDWVNERAGEKKQLTGNLLKQASGLGISPQQAADAVTALSLLQNRATLTEAARLWLEHDARKKTPSVASVIDRLVEEKRNAGMGSNHCNGLKNSLLRLFKGMERAAIGTIDDAVFERALSKTQTSLADRRNKRRDAYILFRFARKKRLVAINPVESVTKPNVPVGEVEILSPIQTARLLWHVHENCPDMVAYFAISIFAGLRNQELIKLKWEDVDLGKKEIEVRAAYAKTRRARQVEIHKTLAEWLLPLTRNEGEFVCPIHPRKTAPDTFDMQARRRAVSIAAKIDPWPSNCLRHGFGSYHFAREKNAGLTASQMGNSEQVVKAFYTKTVRKSAWKIFWNLSRLQAEVYATAPPTDEVIWESEAPEPDWPDGYSPHVDGLGKPPLAPNGYANGSATPRQARPPNRRKSKER